MLGQHVIAPGKSATLKINYKTYKFPGKFDKQVYIETSLPEQAKETINIHGFVDAMPMGELEVAPRKIVVKGLIKGQESLVPMLVKNVGNDTLTLTNIVSKKHKTVLYDAAIKGSIVLAPGESRIVKLPVTPTKAGRFLDFFMVHATDGRNVYDKGYKAVVVGQVAE